MCIVRWRISGGETLVNAATPTTVNEAMTNAATAGERLDRTICFLFIDTNNVHTGQQYPTLICIFLCLADIGNESKRKRSRSPDGCPLFAI
jgi:hypothetical protein